MTYSAKDRGWRPSARCMAVPGERGGCDVGDVVGVDERLTPLSGGQRQLTGTQGLHEQVLAEVLREPGRPQDRPLQAGRAQGRLDRLLMRLRRAARAAS
ncbi:hypothetical protein ACFOY2_15150 [Nonomuraea purpurea]|uniref:Uncharacterized protein n=1 Tax=Nonomuraea purpurea TaxID=1849276 RepID=A0ABV8G3H4_9ACTN